MSERWFPDGLPAPMVSRETMPWWQAAAEHRLVVQRCGECGRFRHPPGPMCPSCRSFDLVWHRVSGRGAVYSYTIVHQAFMPALAESVPYVVAIVELEGAGGARLLSNLVGVDADRVHVGMQVEVVWEDVGPGLSVPRFRPA